MSISSDFLSHNIFVSLSYNILCKTHFSSKFRKSDFFLNSTYEVLPNETPGLPPGFQQVCHPSQRRVSWQQDKSEFWNSLETWSVYLGTLRQICSRQVGLGIIVFTKDYDRRISRHSAVTESLCYSCGLQQTISWYRYFFIVKRCCPVQRRHYRKHCCN